MSEKDDDSLERAIRKVFQPIVDQVLAEGEAQIAAYLHEHRDTIKRLDADEVIGVSLTRAARGLEPHPQLLLAALKVLDQLLTLRAQRGQA